MKIVFLAPFGIRPKGTLRARMLPLAVDLQRLGHPVTIVAPPYTNPEDSGCLETVEGVPIRNILLEPYHRILSTPLLACRMMARADGEFPSLIHLFKPKGYGGVGVMLRLLSPGKRVPILVDTDDWEGEGGMNEIHPYRTLEKRFYAFQERFLLRRCDGVTVASRALGEMVANLRGDDRILHLPNGVGKHLRGDGRRVRERFGLATDTPVVLLYTRFFEFSQTRLHRVVLGVCRLRPQVRFLIVGKGRRGEEELLLDHARENGYAGSLLMAGWVEPEEISDCLAAADLAIYPFDDTLVNRCKCPAKLTELLAAGIPTVADAVGEIPEYIPPEGKPLLCDPADPDGMIRRVVGLVDDVDQRRRLGELLSRSIRERFSWGEEARRLERFYGRFTSVN